MSGAGSDFSAWLAGAEHGCTPGDYLGELLDLQLGCAHFILEGGGKVVYASPSVGWLLGRAGYGSLSVGTPLEEYFPEVAFGELEGFLCGGALGSCSVYEVALSLCSGDGGARIRFRTYRPGGCSGLSGAVILTTPVRHEEGGPQFVDVEGAGASSITARVYGGVRPASEEFMAMLSHEIRTPVSSMMGFLTLLQETSLNAEQQSYVRVLAGLANSMYGLLSDAVDEFRIQDGRLMIHVHYFSLRVELEQLVARYGLQYPGLSVELEYDRGVPSVVRGDGHRVIQVVTNLLSNAFKFTDSGFVRVLVRPGRDEDGEGMVRIGVSDSGVGIAGDALCGIFEPFVQVGDGGALRRGFGLGLHITRRLVELHGGRIGVESVPGEGTTFTVTLPLLRDYDAGAAESYASGLEVFETLPGDGVVGSSSGDAGGLGTGGEREAEEEHVDTDGGGGGELLPVLLVDDNELNILVERKFLDRWGYRVDVASSGAEALRYLTDREYGLVFMDLRMPGMDGFETVVRIRELEGSMRDVPVIALTASTEQGVRTRIHESGMQGYIFKPFRTEELRDVLVRYVGDPSAGA